MSLLSARGSLSIGMSLSDRSIFRGKASKAVTGLIVRCQRTFMKALVDVRYWGGRWCTSKSNQNSQKMKKNGQKLSKIATKLGKNTDFFVLSEFVGV